MNAIPAEEHSCRQVARGAPLSTIARPCAPRALLRALAERLFGFLHALIDAFLHLRGVGRNLLPLFDALDALGRGRGIALCFRLGLAVRRVLFPALDRVVVRLEA